MPVLERLAYRERQVPGDRRCTAFAACYLTGHDVADFERWVAVPPPFHDFHAVQWLALHGYVAGFGAISFGGGGVRLTNKIAMEVSFEGGHGLAVVRSRNHPGFHHMVFWDNGIVYDSDPRAPVEGEPFENFAVTSIIPVTGKTKTPLPLNSCNLLQVDPLLMPGLKRGVFAKSCTYGEGCPICSMVKEPAFRQLDLEAPNE